MAKSTLPSIRHLRVFLTVAELRRVRRAADALYLSQPAVTQAISKVESQVGAVLFERRSSGMYLTEAGSVLARRAGLMFEQIEAALVAFGVAAKGCPVRSIAQRISRAQIRALAAVASGCSFAEAARKLSTSQASLHRAARDLERTVGKPLFQHSLYGIVATRPGSELARRLSLAMLEIDWAVDELRAAEGRLGGELRVGAMLLAGSFLLGPVLNELTKYFPEAHITVRTGEGAAMSRALQIGDIDFVVGLHHVVDSGEIAQEALFASPYVVVARKGHPLSQKAKVSLADLEAYDWVVSTKGAARRPAFDRLFASMNKMPKANIEAYSLATIRSLIIDSDRLTLLTRFEFEFERESGALTTLRYAPIEPADPTGVAWRAKWTPTDLHLKFLELIRLRAAQIAKEESLEQAAA